MILSYGKDSYENAALGRLDYASLSHQALMEMVIDGDDSRKEFQDDSGNYKDIRDWKGVTLDSNGNVTEVRWEWYASALDLRWLPPTLMKFWYHAGYASRRVEKCNEPIQLHICYAQLPENLESFTMKRVGLRGEMDTRDLPRSLEIVDLPLNRIRGSLDLTTLPPEMKKLKMPLNEISGSIDMTSLPDRMIKLDLSSNKISGTLDLTKLPHTMQKVDLFSNKISGSVDVSNLPASFIHLNLSSNAICAPLDLTKLSASTSVVKISHNKISGEVDLTQLPRNLTNLDLDGNDITLRLDFRKSIRAYNRFQMGDWMIRDITADDGFTDDDDY